MNQEIEGKPKRPEWPPYTDVGIEWDREAWAYIQHLEGEIGTLKEHLKRADKTLEAKENYIQELRGQDQVA